MCKVFETAHLVDKRARIASKEVIKRIQVMMLTISPSLTAEGGDEGVEGMSKDSKDTRYYLISKETKRNNRSKATNVKSAFRCKNSSTLGFDFNLGADAVQMLQYSNSA